MGLKACHDRNITHRDIKPGRNDVTAYFFLVFYTSWILFYWQFLLTSHVNIAYFYAMEENMIICFEDIETGKCLREVPSEAKQNKLNM
jgi:serine/threonine protein kinase